MPRSDVRKLVLRLAEADQGWITAWRQALPSDEIAVADRFRDPSDRLAAMAAKALLRVCLGAATGQPPAMIALDRDALRRLIAAEEAARAAAGGGAERRS